MHGKGSQKLKNTL